MCQIRHGPCRPSMDIFSAAARGSPARTGCLYSLSLRFCLYLILSVGALIISACGCADHATSRKIDTHGKASLTILRRQIRPARVIVYRVNAKGYSELVEYAQPGPVVMRVLQGSILEAEKLPQELETAGFFDWPDSALVPPPGEDVDTDPLVIVLDTGTVSRRIFTREPHVPAIVRSWLERIEAAADEFVPADSCLVCIPQLARKPVSAIPEIEDTTSPWICGLYEALPGPFPAVIPLATIGGTFLEEQQVFSIRAEKDTYVVRCVTWP